MNSRFNRRAVLVAFVIVCLLALLGPATALADPPVAPPGTHHDSLC